VEPSLEESKEIVHDKLPKGLLPVKDISYGIDLISKVSLLNLPYYRMHLKESEVLKRED